MPRFIDGWMNGWMGGWVSCVHFYVMGFDMMKETVGSLNGKEQSEEEKGGMNERRTDHQRRRYEALQKIFILCGYTT